MIEMQETKGQAIRKEERFRGRMQIEYGARGFCCSFVHILLPKSFSIIPHTEQATSCRKIQAFALGISQCGEG